MSRNRIRCHLMGARFSSCVRIFHEQCVLHFSSSCCELALLMTCWQCTWWQKRFSCLCLLSQLLLECSLFSFSFTFISLVCLREYSRIAVSSYGCSGRTSGRARVITFGKFSVQLLRWPRPRWLEACMEGSRWAESAGRRRVSSLLRQFVCTCTAESLECLFLYANYCIFCMESYLGPGGVLLNIFQWLTPVVRRDYFLSDWVAGQFSISTYSSDSVFSIRNPAKTCWKSPWGILTEPSWRR